MSLPSAVGSWSCFKFLTVERTKLNTLFTLYSNLIQSIIRCGGAPVSHNKIINVFLNKIIRLISGLKLDDRNSTIHTVDRYNTLNIKPVKYVHQYFLWYLFVLLKYQTLMYTINFIDHFWAPTLIIRAVKHLIYHQ